MTDTKSFESNTNNPPATRGVTKPQKSTTPPMSEGVRQDLLINGETTDPNTGQRLTRDEHLDADGKPKN